MKHIFKKVSSALAAVLTAAALTVTAAAPAWAEEIDATVKETLQTASEQLTEQIAAFTEEEIAYYENSEDAFTVQVMEAWKQSKEELGALKEDQSGAGEIEVTSDGETYTAVVPRSFEKADASFTYVYDASGKPTAMAIDVKYSLGETMRRAALNTVMGIGTVFIMLLFLSFIISLFKYIPDTSAKKKAPAPAPAPAPAVPVQEETDDGELVAVIAAAIAAAEGTSTDGFVVRSIRKVNRRKW